MKVRKINESHLKAKNYLLQVKILEDKIKHKEDLYSELYEKAHSASSIRFDNDRVQTSRTNDIVERNIIKYMELADEIIEDTTNMYKVKEKVINKIQELNDDRFINLLYKKYIQFKDYDVIADEMNYSYDYVKELHRNSIKAFEKIYSDLE